MIFVDETLIQIDGKDYWLWITYEPSLKSFPFMKCIYQEKKGQFLYVINFQTENENVVVDMARLRRM